MKILQKIGYGIVFSLLIPALLVLWSNKLNLQYPLPLLPWSDVGVVFSITGIVLIVWGMGALFVVGKGFPMNAFPPQYYVSSGIYGVVKHPIYVGFTLFCFGVSLYLQSPSGYWIISPLVALGCFAIVLGYEKTAIERNFGKQINRTFIKLPENSNLQRQFSDIVSTIILLGVPWFLVYESGLNWGNYWGGYELSLPFEKTFPVIPWTTSFYSLTYLFVIAVPLLSIRKITLRKFIISGTLATAVGGILLFTIPVIAPLKEFDPIDFWGFILLTEHKMDGKGSAFPSFHAIWIIIALNVYIKEFERYALLFWLISIATLISCFTTGMHSIADIVAGIIVAVVSIKYDELWKKTVMSCQKIANSWHEWHIGNLRIINHGFYAGLGGFFGIFIVSTLLGVDSSIAFVSVVALSSILGAALWAQIIEGSSQLLRPFGYYGSILGGVFGCVLCHLFGENGWQIAAAFCVAAPIVQFLGRFRCLVQGCCHGAKTLDTLGIKVTHPSSRICKIAHLEEQSLYPTQLYSMVGNVIIAPIMLRLWFADVSPTLIIGMYLILSSIARFVEEHYRGEPQTKELAGLRLYQWASIINAVIGIGLTMIFIPNENTEIHLSFPQLAYSTLWGLVSFIALGVDFPKSTKRFSRLT